MKTNTTNNTNKTNNATKNQYKILSKKEMEVIKLMNKLAYLEAKEPQNQRIVQSILASGYQNMMLTGRTWFVAEIPVNLVIVDVYQRPLNQGKVNKLSRTFDWDFVGVKTVNFRSKEGVFALIDGHHTSEVLKLKEQKTICCRVFVDYTYQQEAGLFADQNINVTRLSTADEFFARLEAGEEEACSIMSTLNDFGLKYSKQIKRMHVGSIRKLQRITRKYGIEGLRFSLQVIFDAGWAKDDAKAFSETGLNIGYYAYERCIEDDGDYTKLINKLKEFKTAQQFQDYANYLTGEISTKHPEYAVKEVMPCIFDNRADENIIKVED